EKKETGPARVRSRGRVETRGQNGRLDGTGAQAQAIASAQIMIRLARKRVSYSTSRHSVQSHSRNTKHGTRSVVSLPNLEKPLRTLPSETLPSYIEPMKCQLAGNLPDGNDWFYEVKLD